MTWLSYLDECLLDVLLKHENSAWLDAIERFVASLGLDDTLITFNYDRLLERCLTKCGKRWSFGMEEPHPGTVAVLKMHGSLDWICFARNHRCTSPGIRLLFSKRDTNREREGSGPSRCGEDEYDFELFQIEEDDRLRRLIANRALIQRDYRWARLG